MGRSESTSISASSIRYRLPTATWGRIHTRILQVLSSRRTPSRRRFVKSTRRVYGGLHFDGLRASVSSSSRRNLTALL